MFSLPRITLTFRHELRLRYQRARMRGEPKIRRLVLLFTFYFLLFAFVPSAQAAVDTSQQSFEQSVTSPQYNKQSFDFQTFSGIINSSNVAILGCVSPGLQQQCQQQFGASAVNIVGVMIAALYANPPASGVQYLADVTSRLGVVKPAYAQAGTGFSALSPILPIWRAFRDLAYLAFVIIFVVFGFAIMFRVKISPQAVITIQSALPRIVIALLLVTFSYAIAGFLIDLIYVLISIGFAVFRPLFSPDEIAQLQQQFISGGFPQVIGAVFAVPGTIIQLAAVGALISGAIGFIVGALPGAAAGALVGGGLFLLIIALILLYVLIKLFIELLKAYIGIILSVVFAPLQILLGVLPGQAGFGGWLRGLLANILVFPAVAIVLILARFLVQRAAGPGELWSPPMLAGGALIQTAVPALIGLGMLLMVYKVPEMIKKAMGVEAFPYGAAIGEPIAVAGGALMRQYKGYRATQEERRLAAKSGGLKEYEQELLKRTRPR